jgi:predicted house-cleaning noncanonical NTP pyrophosphatase (MazG superfamily)
MSFETEDHGGECCGVSHIFNFTPLTSVLNRTTRHYESKTLNDEEMEKMISNKMLSQIQDIIEHKEDEDDPDEFGHLFEVVLTDKQMVNFAPLLQKMGFVRVYRFLNDNSTNYCNLLVKYSGDLGDTGFETAPYLWE